MPDRLNHANDEEHGPVQELPLGGLLSELLASEGVDPANIADAAAECGGVDQPLQLQPAGIPGSPPAAGTESEAGGGLDGGIAMPGLLADLIHLDQAARQIDGVQCLLTGAEAEPAAAIPAAAISPVAMPELFSQLSAGAGLEETVEPVDEQSGAAVQDADAVRSNHEPAAESFVAPEAGEAGAVEVESAADGPAASGFDGLAIPELFSLLSAESESEPGAQSPAERSCAAGQAAGDGPEETGQPAESIGAPPDRRAEPDQLAPAEPEWATEQTAAPMVKAAGPVGLESLFAVGAELDSLFCEDDTPLPAAGPPAMAAEEETGPDMVAETGLAPDSEVMAPEWEQPAPAAAAGGEPGDIGGGGQGPDQAELTRLIAQIDSEIAAAPGGPAEAVQSAGQDFERFVVFRLGGNSYGLHMKLVREVDKAGRVTVVPSAPAILHGLINLRGEILPLIDPRPLLGLEPAAWTSGGYLVVVQAHGDEMPVALLVDELGGVAPVDPAGVEPIYSSDDRMAGLAGHVLGQIEHRGRSVLLLDHRRLVTDDALLEAVESRGMELEEAGR